MHAQQSLGTCNICNGSKPIAIIIFHTVGLAAFSANLTIGYPVLETPDETLATGAECAAPKHFSLSPAGVPVRTHT